jgi:hypothetical protein
MMPEVGLAIKPRLFSHRGAGCTLVTMCTRFGNWVIAALLMFQLAIGMQWQVAHPDMAASERQTSGVDAGHCTGHASSHATSTPVHKHDCCGSNDCQCHCAQGPAVLNLSPASAVCSTSLLLPVFDARPPVARTNELFRPPIA